MLPRTDGDDSSLVFKCSPTTSMQPAQERPGNRHCLSRPVVPNAPLHPNVPLQGCEGIGVEYM